MLISSQTALPDLSQQLRHRGITTQINPQHQRVDEQPHQIINSRITPTSYRKPNRHITTGTQLPQQHRQRSLHHHETRRIMLTRQPLNPLLQLRRPLHTHTGAPIISHRRIRPISRQHQPLRHPRQHLLPIPQLPTNTTRRISQITQLRPLPQRVIHILNRQRPPTRNPPRTPAHIRHLKISQQRPDRPTISSNVMHRDHQHILITTTIKKPPPQRNLPRQIKLMTRHPRDRLIQPLPRPTTSINNPPTQLHPLNTNHHLLRNPLHRHKNRPQRLMPTNHITQRRPQRRNIQPTHQPHRHHHVVNRRTPMQLIDKPQPLLRKRQRHHTRTPHHHQRRKPTGVPSAESGCQLSH